MRELRTSKFLKNKIRTLIERGKEIHEIQEELGTWRNEFLAQEGTIHLRRDDFVTLSLKICPMICIFAHELIVFHHKVLKKSVSMFMQVSHILRLLLIHKV
jgi:hypothetical protein